MLGRLDTRDDQRRARAPQGDNAWQIRAVLALVSLIEFDPPWLAVCRCARPPTLASPQGLRGNGPDLAGQWCLALAAVRRAAAVTVA
eukprot:SAG11_NODE_12920_length_679_cov_0.967241_1_plen_86_part_01